MERLRIILPKDVCTSSLNLERWKACLSGVTETFTERARVGPFCYCAPYLRPRNQREVENCGKDEALFQKRLG